MYYPNLSNTSIFIFLIPGFILYLGYVNNKLPVYLNLSIACTLAALADLAILKEAVVLSVILLMLSVYYIFVAFTQNQNVV